MYLTEANTQISYLCPKLCFSSAWWSWQTWLCSNISFCLCLWVILMKQSWNQ